MKGGKLKYNITLTPEELIIITDETGFTVGDAIHAGIMNVDNKKRGVSKYGAGMRHSMFKLLDQDETAIIYSYNVNDKYIVYKATKELNYEGEYCILRYDIFTNDKGYFKNQQKIIESQYDSGDVRAKIATLRSEKMIEADKSVIDCFLSDNEFVSGTMLDIPLCFDNYNVNDYEENLETFKNALKSHFTYWIFDGSLDITLNEEKLVINFPICPNPALIKPFLEKNNIDYNDSKYSKWNAEIYTITSKNIITVVRIV